MKSKIIVFNVMLMIIGLTLIGVGGFILKGEELKAISGTCVGIGAGLFGLSIAKILTLIIEYKNPNIKHKKDIEVKDERNVCIVNRAKAKAFDAIGIVFGILMLIYTFINAGLPLILLVIVAYSIVYVLYIVFFNKYSKEM